MDLRGRGLVLTLVLAFSFALNAQSQSDAPSIGDALRRAATQHRAVHIIFVHGIRQNLPGSSLQFRKSVCAYLKLGNCKDPGGEGKRDWAEDGHFGVHGQRPHLTYMGKLAWQTDEEWLASTPFVVHYVLRSGAGVPIVVDEINWWPLTISLKCREMVDREARGAGSIDTLIDFCSKQTKHYGKTDYFDSYNWIPKDQAEKLKAIRPESALLNRLLKSSILDWGMSDAMMAVGSANSIFMEAMRQLILKSIRFQPDGTESDDWMQQEAAGHAIDREFFMVSHSLGSFLVFSILNSDASGVLRADMKPPEDGSDASTENAAIRYVLKRTPQAYFFANQIPLIELAELQRPGGNEFSKSATPEAGQDRDVLLMKGWRSLRESFNQQLAGEQSTPIKPRVVAWSDPSDLLSWQLARTPELFDDESVQNSWWHWIIANPEKAHDGYDSNKRVIRTMFGPRQAAVTAMNGHP